MEDLPSSRKEHGPVIAYIVRRVLYAIPIMVGVKCVTPDAIREWKLERGNDRPLLYYTQADVFPFASKGSG